MNTHTGLISICVGLVAFLGCGTGTDNPPTYPVTGTVTLKGKPVAGADIVFVPSTPDALAAFAKSDAEGKFAMRTFEPGDGAVTGSYKVKVMKLEQGDVEETPVFDSTEAEAEIYVEGDPVKPPKNLLPPRYADHNVSGLTVSVATEPVTFDIKL
jgi:hypothetical protein